MQRGWTAACVGREGRKARGVVEKRGKLRIRLDGAFILEIADFEVEPFDLAVKLEEGVSVSQDSSRWLEK